MNFGQRRINGSRCVKEKVNIPEVAAEVRALYTRYEEALVTNDVATLMEMFWSLEGWCGVEGRARCGCDLRSDGGLFRRMCRYCRSRERHGRLARDKQMSRRPINIIDGGQKTRRVRSLCCCNREIVL